MGLSAPCTRMDEGGLAKQVQAKNAGINVLDACQQQMWHSAWSSICGALFRGAADAVAAATRNRAQRTPAPPKE